MLFGKPSPVISITSPHIGFAGVKLVIFTSLFAPGSVELLSSGFVTLSSLEQERRTSAKQIIKIDDELNFILSNFI